MVELELRRIQFNGAYRVICRDPVRAGRAEHGRQATLIAATGYGQPTDRVSAADAGFDCHLVKPVRVDELVVMLDERVIPSKEE